METPKTKIEVLTPGTKVKLIGAPEVKTEIRDARVDVFIDAGDTNKVLHVVEYGLTHANNKVYSEKAFEVIATEAPAVTTPKNKAPNP